MGAVRIAIIGAGIGGLAAAIALRRVGIEVEIYEQAAQFRRVGAAIALTPNAVKVLDGLELGEAVRRNAFHPTHRVSRVWDSGRETSRLPLGEAAEKRYGAPQLTTHRADLLAALESAVPSETVRLGKRVTHIVPQGDSVRLEMSDGSSGAADAVIGADGIHSTVRAALFGAGEPHFTGTVSFRTIFPVARVAQVEVGAFTKWWGPTPQSQIVTFLIDGGRERFVFASIATETWRNESWSTTGTKAELAAGFTAYHREAQEMIEASEDILKTALYERDPLPRWTEGRVTLLGDACHPMMPFMAQGAAMGLEDAALLSRCLAGTARAALPATLARYEQARRERTSRMQIASRENEWLRTGIDADWVYGYDAWRVALP